MARGALETLVEMDQASLDEGIVDDVLSTGGTLRAVIDGIRRCGAEVAQVVIVVENGPGMTDLHRDDPMLNLSALIAVDVVDGRVVTRAATSMA